MATILPLLLLTHLIRYLCLYLSLKCWCFSGILLSHLLCLELQTHIHICMFVRLFWDVPWIPQIKHILIFPSQPSTQLLSMNINTICFVAGIRNLVVIIDSYFFLTLPTPFRIGQLVLVILPAKYLHFIPFSSASLQLCKYTSCLLRLLTVNLLTDLSASGLFPFHIFFFKIL